MKKSGLLSLVMVGALILSACSAGDSSTATTHITSPTETTAPTVPTVNTVPTESTEPAPETQPTAEPLPETEALRIQDGFTVRVGEKDRTGILSDNSVYSKTGIAAGETLTVESLTPFSSLYLIWDEIPGAYTVSWKNGSKECGAYDFLHEYVTLPEAVTQVEISFSEDASRLLCDLRGYTYGYAPEDVQLWEPPCEEADILVFPTHSDDDALFFGALISYYAIERQLTVQTAFMVDHRWQPHRAHERLNGLWAMGIRHYPILGSAPDTATFDFQEAMSLYYSSDILGWQVEQIRRFKPLVIVGHDLNGEYGNAGHKVNAHYLTQAIQAAADPTNYPASADAYGIWETPKLYLHLYWEHTWYLDVNSPMANDPQGRTPFQAAQDGFAAHVSQQPWGIVQQNDNNRAYDCRLFGLYHTLVGYDTIADVMENINESYWRSR